MESDRLNLCESVDSSLEWNHSCEVLKGFEEKVVHQFEGKLEGVNQV